MEELAREEVQRAETSGTAERVGLVSAMFRLADTLRAEGKLTESDAVRQRGIEMNRATVPQAASAEQFVRAEALARSGKADDAVQMAREISESPEASGNDASANDQFGFRHLAQSLACEHNAEALQVASVAVLADERRHLSDDVFRARDLTDWVGFYRMLGQPDGARDLLTRAETIARNCWGATSPAMEAVLPERARIEHDLAAANVRSGR